MKIATLARPNNGCDFYRCLLPLQFTPIDKEKDKIKVFYPDGINIPVTERDLAGNMSELESYEPEILFYNGTAIQGNLELLNRLKAKGTIIAIDIDDYWELPSTHPVYTLWYRSNMNNILIESMKIADVVFVTNEGLYKKVLQYNKSCAIIPNAVPFGTENYMPSGSIKEQTKMNFLYAGGSTHYHDLLILKNKFEKIGSEKFVKDNAMFTLAGFNPVQGDIHCQWDRMASIFKRTNSYQVLDTRPVGAHMTFYDQADVVLVPLANSEFNRTKSVLKVIEAATRNLPCIVSKVQPYTDLIDIKGILWDDWIKNIKFCINNPKEVVSLGQQISEQIKQKYDLGIWAITRYQIFEHLINK